MTKGTSGHVYVVGADWQGPIKIGVATDVARRLERLQSGNHVELRVLWQSEALNEPFAIEAELHSRFGKDRVRGEWFAVENISAEMIQAAVTEIVVSPRRTKKQPDEPSAVLTAVCHWMLAKVQREEGLNIENAIGAIATRAGVGRSTVWAQQYRPPAEVTVFPYAALTALFWKMIGRPSFGGDVPYPKDLAAALAETEAAVGIAPSRTGTEG